MKYLKILAFGLTLATSGAWAECMAPDTPAVPDGAEASYDDMVASQQSVKEFQQANQEYLTCMEKDISSAAAVAKNEEASDEEKATAVKQHSEAVEAYNTAVSREEKLAQQFNDEIREYKESNAK